MTTEPLDPIAAAAAATPEPSKAMAVEAPRPQRELSTDTAPVHYFQDLRSFEIGQRQALLLSHTSILPDAYRAQYEKKVNGVMQWVNNPDAIGNCFVALEWASRLRVSPLLIMQQVDVIHGRPGLRGTFLIALINNCGLFSRLRFVCNDKEGDAFGYYAVAKELATGELLVGPTVTWKMVKAEKWQEKNGSKWLSMSELMFQYRCASFWSRLFAADVTMGLQTDDELREVYGEAGAGQLQVTQQSGSHGLADLERDLAQLVVAKPDAPDADADADTALTGDGIPGDQPLTQDDIAGDTGAKPRQRASRAKAADAKPANGVHSRDNQPAGERGRLAGDTAPNPASDAAAATPADMFRTE